MEILTDFGVKPVLLIAQIVNFLLLLFILKRFLYKPLLKVLEERKQKITQSLKNADEIQKRLEQVDFDREKQLQKALKEAGLIVDEAKKTSNKIIAEAHLKAKRDIQKLALQSKVSLKLEKEKLYQEIRQELADLVTISLEKVTGKVLSEKDQRQMIERTTRGL